MNIEEVREYALSLNEQVTEELFVKSWISWRIAGKWFLLTNLDVPEPHVAVKMQPDVAIELRERYEGVGPAIHMNTHWCDSLTMLHPILYSLLCPNATPNKCCCKRCVMDYTLRAG